MATANETATAAATQIEVSSSAEDVTVKAVHKRYEGLLNVRTKAIKGKGAWYWAHLEPILLQSETGLPRAVKLRCSLCDAVFSASNPSRTASEHLKRGTCPNFISPNSAHPQLTIQQEAHTSPPPPPPPKPISSIAPCSSPHFPNSRKRCSSSYQVGPLALMDPMSHAGSEAVYSSSSTPPPPALPPPPPPPPQHFVLSGGKEDLGALALLEDSVKRLKSPKASPGPALSKSQVLSAMSLFSNWFYESCGSFSFSSVDHPKFRAFLSQVGLPPLSRRELAGALLDARYDESRSDAEARIRDALFYQVAAEGWKSGQCAKPDALVSLAVNLPNGTTVFRRAVLAHGRLPSKYAEEVLWETVTEICGSDVHRCAGIIADKFKSTALRDLESQNHRMVNLYCQLQGLRSLVKDFAREIPLFATVVESCSKVANFFNTSSLARNIFRKYQLQEFDCFSLLRVLPSSILLGGSQHAGENAPDIAAIFAMLEDIIASARPIQLAVHDDSFKLACIDDPNARELGEIVRAMAFWSDLEAVHSLIKTINDAVREMESERPLVGQCLPLWDELRSKVKDWCSKFSIDDGPVKKVVEKRFKKNYHPAWAAAFILDPLYLIKDTSGKYLPPFKYLTPEQEKDVDKLITRLVSREEAHIVLMELMKWRSEGLDPLYAQAVQVRQLDPATGKMRIANPQSSRLVWETYLSEEFKSLAKVAVRLIFLHATSSGFRCSPSMLRWVCRHGRSRAGMDRAQKIMFVAAHAKLERRDFSNEEEKDAELFANEEDDVLTEGFVDSSSV